MRLAQGHLFPPSRAFLPRQDVRGHLRQARDALARGDPAAALAAFDQALAERPDLAIARAGRLVCLARLGRAEELSGEIEADVRSGRTEALLEVATLCIVQGRVALALDVVGILAMHAPGLCSRLLEDPRLAQLRDHPVFLQMMGAF